jgi:hypothetical protein
VKIQVLMGIGGLMFILASLPTQENRHEISLQILVLGFLKSQLTWGGPRGGGQNFHRGGGHPPSWS